jgi:hypothetical protein
MQMASSYPPFKPLIGPGSENPVSPRYRRQRDVGVQAVTAGEGGVQARRPAPTLPSRRPATKQELRDAQSLVVDKLMTKYSDLRAAFRALDSDGSGGISREEFTRFLHIMNAHIRKEVLDELFDLIDYDMDGKFDYLEFMRVFNSADINNMERPQVRVDNRGEQARRAVQQKRAAQERIAANLGLTVDEYCDYCEWHMMERTR